MQPLPERAPAPLRPRLRHLVLTTTYSAAPISSTSRASSLAAGAAACQLLAQPAKDLEIARLAFVALVAAASQSFGSSRLHLHPVPDVINPAPFTYPLLFDELALRSCVFGRSTKTAAAARRRRCPPCVHKK